MAISTSSFLAAASIYLYLALKSGLRLKTPLQVSSWLFCISSLQHSELADANSKSMFYIIITGSQSHIDCFQRALSYCRYPNNAKPCKRPLKSI